MLVKWSSDKTVSETAVALQAAVQANHFGVMQVHNLQEAMAKKAVEFVRECLILEDCQPQVLEDCQPQAKRVLEQNMRVSTALPCRISIYQEGGKTILAALKPTTLLAMFNLPQNSTGSAGTGRYDGQNHDKGGIRLIGRPVNTDLI